MKNTAQKSSSISRFALVTLILSALALSGCHTMDGAGKDIERAGEKIQDNAK